MALSEPRASDARPVAVLAALSPPTSVAQEPGSAQARIIFLHHSTGQGVIEQGGLQERLTALGYEFYDNNYNENGLVLTGGTSAGTNLNIPPITRTEVFQCRGDRGETTCSSEKSLITEGG